MARHRRVAGTLALLAVIASLQLLGAAPASAGYPSSECSGTTFVNEGLTYFNGYVGNTFVRLLQDHPNPSTSRFCIAVDTGTAHFGGQAVITTNALGAIVVDDAWTQCDTAGNKAFEETGEVGPVPFAVDVNRLPSGDVWLCVMVNNTTLAKRIMVKASVLPGVAFLPDDPAPIAYGRGRPPPGVPSEACQKATSGNTRILDYNLLAYEGWLYTWSESSSRAHVCARFSYWNGNPPEPETLAGGRLTLDALGGQTLVTVDESGDFTPCDTNVLTLSNPPTSLKLHAGTPAWLCVRAGTVERRVKLDTAGSQGIATFTPDP